MRLPGPDAAHLWILRTEGVLDAVGRASCASLLSPDETARHARFLVEHARDEYLLTRMLVRTVLSRYAPVAPEDWRFVRDEHGRPEVAGPAGAPRPRFNLSNTPGLVACLLRAEGDLGVDVEDVERRSDTVSVADRYFAPAELETLRSLPEPEQRLRFFEYWTLKEAYIKARGLGLALPLDQFAFDLDSGPTIRVAFDPRLGDDPHAWQFGLMRPTPRHVLAWAIRAGAGVPALRVETFEEGSTEEAVPKAP